MRRVTIGTAALVAMLTVGTADARRESPYATNTAADLSWRCQELETVSVVACLSFVEGYATGVNFFQSEPKRVCLPPTTDAHSLRLQFLTYLAGHPEKSKETRGSVLALAFAERFPCPAAKP